MCVCMCACVRACVCARMCVCWYVLKSVYIGIFKCSTLIRSFIHRIC